MSINAASLSTRSAFASWASFWKSLIAHGYPLDIAPPLLFGSSALRSPPRCLLERSTMMSVFDSNNTFYETLTPYDGCSFTDAKIESTSLEHVDVARANAAICSVVHRTLDLLG